MKRRIIHAFYGTIVEVLAFLAEKSSNTKFWSLYKESCALHKSSQKDVANCQRNKLFALVGHAKTKTEIWRELPEPRGDSIISTLSEIPISNKQYYASGFPDKVTAIGNKSDWQYLSSSGTTGRMTVVVDFNKRDYLRASEVLNIKLTNGTPNSSPSIDIPPSACNLVCGMKDSGPEPFLKFFLWSLKNNKFGEPEFLPDLRGRFERQYLFNREMLAPIDTAPWPEMLPQIDDYLDKIISNKIEVVRALPHFLLWLAVRARQRKLSFIHLKRLIPYGGLAGDALIKTITEVFSSDFFNLYGTGEVGSIGCSSSEDVNINIYNNMVIIEIIDDAGQSVEVGEIGRVVVTDLNNYAMPIIRYDIEDVAELIEVNELTSLPSKIKVHGRQKETYVASSGKLITPLQIQNYFFAIDNVVNYKIEFVSKSLIKVTIMSLAPVPHTAIRDDIQRMFEVKTRPIIKDAPFILPESSGKFISIKPKREANYV